MPKNICAPGRTIDDNGSCYTQDELIQFANAFNEYIKTDTKGALIKQPITISNDKRNMLSQLKHRFSNVCNDENCIVNYFIDIMRVQLKIVGGVVKPDGPTGKTEWLSNFEIESILTQYENVFPSFKFLGAVAANCSSVEICSLYNVNFDDLLKQNKHQLGIVFNKDVYGESGSHWVAVFIDLKKGEIDYCDSIGKSPNQFIQKFIDSYRQYHHQKHGSEPMYLVNKNGYQKDNSECGIYSCNFILRRLKGQSFHDIIKNYLSFDEINSCRAVYFKNVDFGIEPHWNC